MYKIMYSDGAIKEQCSIVIQGKRYGKVYLSEAAAQHAKYDLSYMVDDDGTCYESPLDYAVEKVDQQDFEARPQCIVIRCRKCHGELNDDPIPLFSNLKKLTWDLVIDPDGFTHDAGCESLLLRHIPT